MKTFSRVAKFGLPSHTCLTGNNASFRSIDGTSASLANGSSSRSISYGRPSSSIVGPGGAAVMAPWTVGEWPTVRIGQLGPLNETQRDPAREEHDREQRLRRLFGGPKADDQGVVIVVDELDGAGQSLAHLGKHNPRLCHDGWRVPGKERIELG